MSDLITQLCQLAAEILKDHPHADKARWVGLLKQVIYDNSQLGQAIQNDRQLIQINQGDAKAFQTLVTGGIANIGIHLTDVNRETLQQVVQEVFGDLLKSLQKQIPSNVRQGSKNFVGREEELAEIHTNLQEGQGVIVCAVEGMGGVGKTELALQYAWRYEQEYVAQYWLRVREVGLAQEVVNMARGKIMLPEEMKSDSLEEKAAWYWQNWLPDKGRILVILDDVPNLEGIPDIAMPIDSRFRLLITARERDLDQRFHSVPLRVLPNKKSLELFKKIVGETKVDKELAAVDHICEILEHLPLAIELAGEYMVKNRSTCPSFVMLKEKLKEKVHLADKSLLARDRKNRSYAYRGLEAAIQLSWEDISLIAQQVAMLLGLFPHMEIQWKLVENIVGNTEITSSNLAEAWEQLDRLHLIQPVDQECFNYRIHSLVHEFFRNKLEISDQTTKQTIYFWFLGLIRSDVVLGFDNSISSTNYARLIRESRKAYYDVFGALSQMILSTNHNGALPNIGAYIYDSDEATKSKNILYAEHYGEEYEEYFELPEEIVSLPRQELFNILCEEKKFISFSTSSGNENLDIPLKSEFKKLRENLSKIIGTDCSLPTNNSTLMEESAWYAAYFLTGKYPLTYFPRTIPVIEIKDCLSKDSVWSNAVSKYKRNCLQMVFEKLRSKDLYEFLYPWNDRYSQDPQKILNFVTTVYQEALSAYQDIVERWFCNFTRHLETIGMFPIAIEGVVITSPDGSYSIDWCWIPLKKGSSNHVRFKLSKASMTEDEVNILLNNLRDNEKQFTLFHRYTTSNLFTPKFPVTHIVYRWLWNDLEKLKLVSGNFSPNIW